MTPAVGVFLAIGVVLILSGLWRMKRRSTILAAAGFVLLIAGSILIPPMMMSASQLPWSPAGLMRDRSATGE